MRDKHFSIRQRKFDLLFCVPRTRPEIVPLVDPFYLQNSRIKAFYYSLSVHKPDSNRGKRQKCRKRFKNVENWFHIISIIMSRIM